MLLLNPIAGELHGEVGGVIHELALGQPHLQFDLAPRLLEQPFAFGGRQRRDPLLLLRRFLRRRVAAARRSRRAAPAALRSISASCAAAADLDFAASTRSLRIALWRSRKVGGERLLQEPPEPAEQDDEVDRRPEQRGPACLRALPRPACSPCSAATPAGGVIRRRLCVLGLLRDRGHGRAQERARATRARSTQRVRPARDACS